MTKPVSTKELNLYGKEDKEDGPVLSVTEHLDELRNRLLIILAVLIISILIGFLVSKEIIRLLTVMAPPDTNFFQIKPGEFFFTSMRVAFYIGIALASPAIIWQLAGFIFPGLNKEEKKVSVPILTTAPLLFVLGSVFAYFFVAPSMLKFLFGFGRGVIATSISIESFVSFSLMIMAVCGITFLLPVILLALASAGIIDSDKLISSWRYAVILSVLLGAVLTPTPDPFNMFLVSGILITLYFISYGMLKALRM